jgi:hypothetical protein
MNYEGCVPARNLDWPYGKFGLGKLLPGPSLDTKVCNNMFKIIYPVHIFRSDRSNA